MKKRFARRQSGEFCLGLPFNQSDLHPAFVACLSLASLHLRLLGIVSRNREKRQNKQVSREVSINISNAKKHIEEVFSFHKTDQAHNQGGRAFGAFDPPKFSKHSTEILTYAETSKE